MYKLPHMTCPPAPLWRRLGALFYDLLASIALLMFATACWLPFYGGHPIPSGTVAYQLSLVGVLYLYFGYCWHRGQTLGMRAWRLYVVNKEGGRLSLRQTLIRFAVAPFSALIFGLGYAWALFGTHQTWHDLCSHSIMYYQPKKATP